MKKLLLIALTLILAAGFFTISNAAAPVTERPDIQIVINGTQSSYSNSPIIVNGRTLLPLRELLTNLGVSNDDQHIVWNSKESSVSVTKDAVQLYLKVGSLNAKVNGADVTLDAAPVNYKASIYIPAKFAAEAFDMVVVWDGKAKRVYMRNESDFNDVRELLEKSAAAMEGLKRYQYKSVTTAIDTDPSGEVNDPYVTVSYGFIDQANQTSGFTWYTNYLTSFDNYIYDKKIFMKNVLNDEWSVTDLSEEGIRNYFHSINTGDVLFAALSIDRSQGEK